MKSSSSNKQQIIIIIIIFAFMILILSYNNNTNSEKMESIEVEDIEKFIKDLDNVNVDETPFSKELTRKGMSWEYILLITILVVFFFSVVGFIFYRRRTKKRDDFEQNDDDNTSYTMGSFIEQIDGQRDQGSEIQSEQDASFYTAGDQGSGVQQSYSIVDDLNDIQNVLINEIQKINQERNRLKSRNNSQMRSSSNSAGKQGSETSSSISNRKSILSTKPKSQINDIYKVLNDGIGETESLLLKRKLKKELKNVLKKGKSQTILSTNRDAQKILSSNSQNQKNRSSNRKSKMRSSNKNSTTRTQCANDQKFTPAETKKIRGLTLNDVNDLFENDRGMPISVYSSDKTREEIIKDVTNFKRNQAKNY